MGDFVADTRKVAIVTGATVCLIAVMVTNNLLTRTI